MYFLDKFFKRIFDILEFISTKPPPVKGAEPIGLILPSLPDEALTDAASVVNNNNNVINNNTLNLNVIYGGPNSVLQAHMQGIPNWEQIVHRSYPVKEIVGYSPELGGTALTLDRLITGEFDHNGRDLAGFRNRKFRGMQEVGVDDPMTILRSPGSVRRLDLALDTTQLSSLSGGGVYYENVFQYLFHKISHGEFHSNFEVFAFMEEPKFLSDGSRSRRVVTFKRGNNNLLGSPLDFRLFIEDRNQESEDKPFLVPVLYSSEGFTLHDLFAKLDSDEHGPFEPSSVYFGGVNFNTGRLAFKNKSKTQICLYDKFVEQKRRSPQFKGVLRMEFRFQLSEADRAIAKTFGTKREVLPNRGARFKRNSLFLLHALRELSAKTILAESTAEQMVFCSLRVQYMLLSVLGNAFNPFTAANIEHKSEMDPLWVDSVLCYLGAPTNLDDKFYEVNLDLATISRYAANSIKAYQLIVIDTLAEKYRFDMTSHMKEPLNSYQKNVFSENKPKNGHF